MVGFVAHEMFGAEVEVASRAALAANALETMKDIVVSEDPMWLKLMGVGGVTAQRAGDAVVSAQAILKSHALAQLAQLEPLMLADRRGTIEVTRESWLAVTADIGQLLLSVPSSSRNILKSRMMRMHNVILDSRGRVKIRADFDTATERAVALGFRPTREARLDAVITKGKEDDLLIQEASDVILAAYHRYVYVHEMDPAHANSVRLLVQEVQDTLGNPVLVEELRQSLQSKIFENPQTREDRELEQFFNRYASDNITQGLIMDSESMLNPGNVFNKQAVVIPFADTLKGTKDAGDK
jgi:hypothetical protein